MKIIKNLNFEVQVRAAFVFLFIALMGSRTEAQEAIKISHSPYIQGLTETGVSIVWTTNKPAIAWVELAPEDGTHFYKEERPKFFAAKDGFKSVGTVHEVKLTNLQPNTTYRYRVYAQEVLQHHGTRVNYGNTVATGVYRQEPLKFKTNGPKEEINFAVVNDIHGKNEVLRALLGQVDKEMTDFIVFNGDMVDNLLSEQQMFEGFMDTATELFASEIPMYYARGNHETRGPFAFEYSKYFPTPTGKLYYSFYVGEAGFIVLDCGEDKPDSDIEYSGIVDMDAYRTQQAEWLKQELQNEKFKKAKHKIVICHMPPFGGWHGEEEIAKKFVPLLNEAGAQIMLTGHLHTHRIVKENDIHHFPVIVNSNTNWIKVSLKPNAATFEIRDQEGKLIEELKL